MSKLLISTTIDGRQICIAARYIVAMVPHLIDKGQTIVSSPGEEICWLLDEPLEKVLAKYDAAMQP